MKKSTILIPLAALALSGCVFTPTKPSSGTTGGNPTSQQPGPGDSGTPQPGTSDSSGGGGQTDPTSGTSGGGGTTVTPPATEHSGKTADDAFTPAEACAVALAQPSRAVSEEKYYVKGEVTNKVTEGQYAWSLQYGSFSFYLGEFYCHTLKNGPEHQKFPADSDLEVGDTVTVYGQLQNYESGDTNIAEMSYKWDNQASAVKQEGYVYDIEKSSSTDPKVNSVSVSPSTKTVNVDGADFQLTANVSVSGGAAQTVTWSVSEGSSIVNVSDSGLVHILAVGSAKVRATSTVDSTKYGECAITVNPAGTVEEGTLENPLTPARAIELCDAAGTGVIVGNKEYYVKGIFDTGTTVNTDHHQWYGTLSGTVFKISGATNDSGVAVTESNGQMDGKEIICFGYIELYDGVYKMGYLPANASPTGSKYVPSIKSVSEPSADPKVNSVSVSPTEVTKYTGDANFTITPTVSVSGGAAQTVSWSVSQGDSVTVSNGTVSIVKAGVSKVRATSTVDSTKYAECTVTVNQSAAQSVAVTPATQTLQVNGTQQFSASVSGVGNVSQEVIWSVYPETAGSITSAGLFTAGASAAADVKVKATSVQTSGVFGEATVQIQETAVTPEITGVTGLKASTSLEVGGSDEQLSATVTGIGAFDSSIDWVSADPSKVEVSSTGLIHAVAATTTPVNVTAFAHGDHNFSMSCAVTVTEPVAVNTVKLAYETARALPVDANKSSTSNTAEVEFTGVVTARISNSFYVQDGDYGIYVYNKQVTGIDVGKLITIKSTLCVYQGLVETVNNGVSSAVLGESATVPSPVSVTSTTQLAGLNQAILVNCNGLIVKEANTTYSTSKNADMKFTLNGQDVTVSFSKYNYSTWSSLVSGLAVGDTLNIEKATVSNYKGTNQFQVTGDSIAVESTDPLPDAVTGVTVSSSGASVEAEGTMEFSAVVSGTGTYTQNVTWSVEPSSAGSFSGSTFTAGSTAQSNVVIRATSVDDTSVSGTKTISIVEKGSTPVVSSVAKYGFTNTYSNSATTTTATIKGWFTLSTGTDIVSSISSPTQVYPGVQNSNTSTGYTQSNVLKMASNNNAGSITIALSQNISKVVLTGACTKDRATIQINSTDVVGAFTKASGSGKDNGGVTSDFSDIYVEFASATNSITITVASGGPAFFANIEFFA